MKVLHFVISLGSKLTHFVGAVVRKTEIWLFGVLEFDPGSPKNKSSPLACMQHLCDASYVS